jgi:hypothetical protein
MGYQNSTGESFFRKLTNYLLHRTARLTSHDTSYSFKGATGSGNADYFPRPLEKKVTYGVIFDTATDQITIQRWKNWKWPDKVSRADIDTYLRAEAKVMSVSG